MQTLEKLLEDSPPLQVPCHLHRRESPHSRGLFPGFTCGNINENTYHHVSHVAGGVCVMIPAIWRRFWQRGRKKQKDIESLVALTLTLHILEGSTSFFSWSLKQFKVWALETSRSDLVGFLVALHSSCGPLGKLIHPQQMWSQNLICKIVLTVTHHGFSVSIKGDHVFFYI